MRTKTARSVFVNAQNHAHRRTALKSQDSFKSVSVSDEEHLSSKIRHRNADLHALCTHHISRIFSVLHAFELVPVAVRWNLPWVSVGAGSRVAG